jgi:hypothetical protein
MNPPLDAVDLLSEQGMKGVGDPDRRSHFSGATCSSSIGRTLVSEAQPTHNFWGGIYLSLLHSRFWQREPDLLPDSRNETVRRRFLIPERPWP